MCLQALVVLAAVQVGISGYRLNNQGDSWVAEKKELLRYLSLVEMEDGSGGMVKAIRVTGVNLQIVNGLGATNGYPLNEGVVDPLVVKTNGVGNLIIGYNETLSNPFEPDPLRSGSHHLVGGIGNAYTGFGGIVFGREGETSAAYSSVLGGRNNAARGVYSSVVGGGGFSAGSVKGNVAKGDLSTIVGGTSNVTNGVLSVAGGGTKNVVNGNTNVIVGGFSNRSDGAGGVVCGGEDNRTEGNNSHVCGGEGNRALGNESNVGGGFQRIATEAFSWVAGSLVQDS